MRLHVIKRIIDTQEKSFRESIHHFSDTVKNAIRSENEYSYFNSIVKEIPQVSMENISSCKALFQYFDQFVERFEFKIRYFDTLHDFAIEYDTFHLKLMLVCYRWSSSYVETFVCMISHTIEGQRRYVNDFRKIWQSLF